MVAGVQGWGARMTDSSAQTHVVVVGGGLAGVACAKLLADDQRARVTLLDRNGHHEFQPLLYQVATAELSGRDMSFELSRLFAKEPSVSVRTAEVAAADVDTTSVTLADGETITGDVLVLAAGAQPNFFRTPGAAEHSFPLYSLSDAMRVRARVLEIFADVAAHPELADEGALTFVVVGAGPTGVETAGALAELTHNVMPHVYDDLPVARVRVILVDLSHTVLPAFSDQAHEYATKQLRKRGVELRLGYSVTEVAPDHVKLSDGTTLPTHLVVWGGGEMAAPLANQTGGLTTGHGGRVDVLPDLTVAGHPNVYALGDFANIASSGDGADPLPQLGSVAQQSGDWAARNILSELDGLGRRDFQYHDKGIMAMIGRKAAVAEIGEHRREMHGRVAFAAWLGVHAQLLANAGAEARAFTSWAEEFYVRPHHRSAELLRESTQDEPRIDWDEPYTGEQD
jgi:NADH:quinone reductase (non-electrogenic)